MGSVYSTDGINWTTIAVPGNGITYSGE